MRRRGARGVRRSAPRLLGLLRDGAPFGLRDLRPLERLAGMPEGLELGTAAGAVGERVAVVAASRDDGDLIGWTRVAAALAGSEGAPSEFVIAAPAFLESTRRAAERAAGEGTPVRLLALPVLASGSDDATVLEQFGGRSTGVALPARSILDRVVRVVEGATAVAGVGAVRELPAGYALYMRGELVLRAAADSDGVTIALLAPRRRQLQVHEGNFARVGVELHEIVVGLARDPRLLEGPGAAREAAVPAVADAAGARVTAHYLPWRRDGERAVDWVGVDAGGRPVLGVVRDALTLADVPGLLAALDRLEAERDVWAPGSAGRPRLVAACPRVEGKARSLLIALGLEVQVRDADLRLRELEPPPRPAADEGALDGERRGRHRGRRRRRGRPEGDEAEERVAEARAPGGRERSGPQPDAAQPDAAQPDAAQPDAAQPDAAQPDAAQPDAAQPDAEAAVSRGTPPFEEAVGAESPEPLAREVREAGERPVEDVRARELFAPADPAPRLDAEAAERDEAEPDETPSDERQSDETEGDAAELEAAGLDAAEQVEGVPAVEPDSQPEEEPAIPVEPKRPRRMRAAIVVRDDLDSVLAGLVLARERRNVLQFWVCSQDGLMDYFKTGATDLSDNTDILLVGFTAQPVPHEVMVTAELYRGRLIWFDHHEWPVEDTERLREAIGGDSIVFASDATSSLAAVMSIAERRSRFTDKLVDLAGRRLSENDMQRWGYRMVALLQRLVASTGDQRAAVQAVLAGKPAELPEPEALYAAEAEWIEQHDPRMAYFGEYPMVVVHVPESLDAGEVARRLRARTGSRLSLAIRDGDDVVALGCNEEKRHINVLGLVDQLGDRVPWLRARSGGDRVGRLLVEDLPRHPERLDLLIGEIVRNKSVLYG